MNDAWLQALNDANQTILAPTMVVAPHFDGHMTADMKRFFEKGFVERFVAFTQDPNYAFLAKRIAEQSKQTPFFENRMILVLYYFAKRYPSLMQTYWPYDRRLLNSILSDLGIASRHPL